jgi:hypothetical protein
MKRLQDDNLELQSRIFVLEAENRLRVIIRKDEEVRDLEMQLRQVSEESDTAERRTVGPETINSTNTVRHLELSESSSHLQ